jgi:hypothetical protein
MIVRTDVTSRTPVIGDRIVYNPPRYKGIVIAVVVEITRSGSPRTVLIEDHHKYTLGEEVCIYTPRTGFAILF